VTIDPANAPIFGDAIPADPPRPVRIATTLLLGNVLLVAADRLYTAFNESFPVFLIPLSLATWFALSVRAGRGWARTASTVLSCLMIAMMALLINHGIVDLLALMISAVMSLTAIRLIWRGDVNDYFVHHR
jgi:hypothetical protein